MSKYVIEIEEKPLCVFDKDTQTFFPRLWRVKGFNSLVLDEEGLSRLEELNSDYINEHYGSLQDDAYKRGLEDGKAQSKRGCEGCRYECENKRRVPCILCSDNIKLPSTINPSKLKSQWTAKGDEGCEGCLYNDGTKEHSPCDICCNAYLNRWTAKQTDEAVKRGDVVRHKINGLTYIVTLASDCGYVLLGDDGNFATSCITNTFEKTGKHFDIDKILKEMKGGNDK